MTEQEIGELLTVLAKQIEKTCLEMECERPFFALLLFNDPKVAQYVSNCERKSMIEALLEAAERLSSGQDVSR